MIIVTGGVEALASRPVSHRRHAIRKGRLGSKVAINRFASISESVIVRTETMATTGALFLPYRGLSGWHDRF
jgi:hypothetical protein